MSMVSDNSVISGLSFVTALPSGKHNFWTPERPDSYADAIEMGKEYGAEFLAYIRRTGDGMILKSVIQAMVLGGQFTAVEVGFCTELHIYIMDISPAAAAAAAMAEA